VARTGQSRALATTTAVAWGSSRSGSEGGQRAGAFAIHSGRLALAAALVAAAGSGAGLTGSGGENTRATPFASCAAASDTPSSRVYRASEVATHTTPATGVWVTYQGSVYDITKFIVNHPGGQDKISLAAGKDIGPYWRLYPQHTRTAYPQEVLGGMKIGSLHPDDVKAAAKEADPSDPYSADPEGSSVLHYHMKRPTNAEAPGSLLGASWITPSGLWFVRNHHPVPHIAADEHRMTISGRADGKRDFTLNVAQLKEAYPKHSIVSSVQCGGNRRAGMNEVKRTNGSPWAISAMSTAQWGGARLGDVLRSLGVDEEYVETHGIKHVIFEGAEDMQASIPIRKALDRYGDTLLAYEMNGEAVPESHGHPLRLVVPGHVGVRNVKWVKNIVLSADEATGPWQRGMSYKGFGPSTTSLEGIDVAGIPSLQEQPVQSAITLPTAGSSVAPGDVVSLKGYAYSGGGRGIVRVDVSVDGGKMWKNATLGEGSHQPLDRAWAWTLWELDVELPEDLPVGSQVECICKATDASYNVQPDTVQGIWNLRGINNNAWHRVSIPVVAAPDDEEE